MSAAEKEETPAEQPPAPVLSFHQLQRRLAALNLEGARIANAAEQASCTAADRRALR